MSTKKLISKSFKINLLKFYFSFDLDQGKKIKLRQSYKQNNLKEEGHGKKKDCQD